MGRILRERTSANVWAKGAAGEEGVGRRLFRLDPERWTVINDLVLDTSGTNIDHIVIGPPGVLSLNTKHLSGRVSVTAGSFAVNGYRTNYMPKATAEAKRISETLTRTLGRQLVVRPVIVVVGAALDVKRQPDDVYVVARRRVKAWLESLPHVLTAEEVSLIATAARNPLTWNPPLTVRELRRYGKHRLYFEDPKGHTLGYYDVTAGRLHLIDTGSGAYVESVVTAFLATNR